MKVTFISPFPDLTAFGLRSIAGYIAADGFETNIIFLPDPEFDGLPTWEERAAYRYPEAVMDRVTEIAGDSDLVGISLFTCYLPQSVQLTERFRKTGIPVMWGGKHPSADPEESLEHADMVCVGEGEQATLELVQKMRDGLDYFDTPNFCFNTTDGIRRNDVGPLLGELDAAPVPSYTFCPHYVWKKEAGIVEPLDAKTLESFLPPDPFNPGGRVYQTMTTRGCPYNCTYCFTFKKLYKGQRYVRRRTVQNILVELHQVKEAYPFVTHVSICDDEFLSLKKEVIFDFADRYEKEMGLALSCLASPWNIKEEKLEPLVKAGLRTIQMGIETVSHDGKVAYKRKTPDEKVLSATRVINKYSDRVMPLYDFIIDNPYESIDDIVFNLRFIMKIPRPYHLDIFSLVLFKGTELYQRALDEGKIANTPEHYLKVYRNYDRRYLNLIFLMFNYKIPNPVIRFLISRPVVAIFETRPMSFMIFAIVDLMKATGIRNALSKLKFIKK